MVSFSYEPKLLSIHDYLEAEIITYNLIFELITCTSTSLSLSVLILL
jgi:hypothetical protein